jgi:TPR repeat protein
MIYYKKAADENNSDAISRLGQIYENGLLGQEIDMKKAINYYKKAIDLDENAEAMNCIGSIYYKGKHLKQNYTLAFETFQRAAKFGNLDAMNNLGICYEYGNGVSKNVERAMV